MNTTTDEQLLRLGEALADTERCEGRTARADTAQMLVARLRALVEGLPSHGLGLGPEASCECGISPDPGLCGLRKPKGLCPDPIGRQESHCACVHRPDLQARRAVS